MSTTFRPVLLQGAPAGGTNTGRWGRRAARLGGDPDDLGVDGGSAAAPGPDWCFDRRTRRLGIAAGPVAIAVAVVAGGWTRGPVAYPAAWAATGGVFIVPAAMLVGVVRQRCAGEDRLFWGWWLAGLLAACGFGACILAQPVDPALMHHLAPALLASAAVLWGSGLAFLTSRTDGARILAIDALELLVADVMVVAPVAVLGLPAVAHARDGWFAVPAAAAAAGLPLVAGISITLCVRLPASERWPELIGTVAAVIGELDALLQVGQGVDGFRLPAAPLLAVQGCTMWLVLVLVLHAHRQFPEGLSRLSPDAQVRRWSALPLLVVASVPALAVEAVTAPATRPWVVPAVVGVLGAAVVLMTARHLLVVNETARLHHQLAVEAAQRRRLLDDLVRAVDDDRHRVVAQLHELAVEYMAAIGAVLRTCAGDGDSDQVVAGALHRIYNGVGAQAESLRRLMNAVRPPAFTGESLRTAVTASTASIFGRGRAPAIAVHVADEIELDWTTSTIVYRLVLECLRGAHFRAPVSSVVVEVGATGPSGALQVVVTDDAAGDDPMVGPEEPRLSTLRLFADLAHGTVEVTRAAGGGARVCATFGVLG